MNWLDLLPLMRRLLPTLERVTPMLETMLATRTASRNEAIANERASEQVAQQIATIAAAQAQAHAEFMGAVDAQGAAIAAVAEQVSQLQSAGEAQARDVRALEQANATLVAWVRGGVVGILVLLSVLLVMTAALLHRG